jgi:hypothetical protein
MNLKTVVKATLLFSVCFLSVVLIVVHEWSVGTLSPRGVGMALALLGVGGPLALVFVLVFVPIRKAKGRTSSGRYGNGPGSLK